MVKLWWNNRENILDTPNLTIQQLLEAGVHLGHKTFRWNPKKKNKPKNINDVKKQALFEKNKFIIKVVIY